MNITPQQKERIMECAKMIIANIEIADNQESVREWIYLWINELTNVAFSVTSRTD